MGNFCTSPQGSAHSADVQMCRLTDRENLQLLKLGELQV